jgi:5-methylcytosine-specific restriction endonuclease McrA
MHHIWKRRSDLNDRVRSVTELYRATPSERGYDAAWNRLAKRRREADDWLCQPCLSEGRITASNTVDHIIPIHVRSDWRLAFDNTQVICCSCHRRKTNEDTMRYGSSESRVITHDQRCARDEALRMNVPPRCAA